MNINANGNTITCSSSDKGKSKSAGGGTLTCPDIENYCSRIDCPNRCNANGMCVKGQCICGFGFSDKYC